LSPRAGDIFTGAILRALEQLDEMAANFELLGFFEEVALPDLPTPAPGITPENVGRSNEQRIMLWRMFATAPDTRSRNAALEELRRIGHPEDRAVLGGTALTPSRSASA